MADDNFTMPPENQVDSLIRLGSGVLISVNVGPVGAANSSIAHLKMVDLVSYLLENKTMATKLVGPLMGAGTTEKQVVESLTALKALIPHMKHDIRSPAFYISALMVPTIAIALRLYVRKFKMGKVRVDDWFSLITLVSLYLCMASFSAVNKTSLHIWDMSFKDYQKWWIVIWSTGPIFNLAHWFVKITFLVFYYALTPARWYRYSIYSIGTFVTNSMGVITSLVFQCIPVNFWDHLGTMKCTSIKLNLFISGILYVLLDFAILLLPVTTVWKLQLAKREKFIVITIFSLMAFICVVSINRLIAVLDWFDSYDSTYKVVDHGVWAAIELDLALAISCLPAIKALFPYLRFGLSSSSASSASQRAQKAARQQQQQQQGDSGMVGSGSSGGAQKKSKFSPWGRNMPGLSTMGSQAGVTTVTITGGDDAGSSDDERGLRNDLEPIKEGEIRLQTSISHRYDTESIKSDHFRRDEHSDTEQKKSSVKESYEML